MKTLRVASTKQRGRWLANSATSISAWVALALFASAINAAPIQDGPYLFKVDEKSWRAQWIHGDEASPQVRSESVRTGAKIRVDAVGSLPAFEVTIRAPGARDPDEIAIPAASPLFVMADTHGEYEI